VAKTPGRRIAIVAACVVGLAILLPVGARGVSSRLHDDSQWSNALRSLGGIEVPFDFAIFLGAAEDVRDGTSPYVRPEEVAEGAPAPYVYPPLLAIVLIPATALPETVAGSSVVGILVSLLLIACVVGTLLALEVRDWRCYPVALLYPATLENVEYGALGPVLALLVALAWRHRERVAPASVAVGATIVLKLFLWPLLVWLAATRRWAAAVGATAVGVALVLFSWAVIGFAGLRDYPTLLRTLSDLEARNSYSAFAILRAAGLSDQFSRLLVTAAAGALLYAAWRVARHAQDGAEGDRRSLVITLAAAFVLTPILWIHYLVLLLVPIALARPRLSALWLVPLAMTVFELLDWYRGWPRGDGWALASVGVVVAVVLVVSAHPVSAGKRRLAAWL
jgi:Glycosyltransferase family 87